MGICKPSSENYSTEFDTLLNIFVLNSRNKINKINYLREIRPENSHTRGFKKFLHKFYGWKFYDFENNISSNLIKEIRKNMLLNKKNKSNNRKNVIIYFDDNDSNINEEIIKSIAEIPLLDGKIYSESDQPLLLFVSFSNEKNTKYYRNILKELMESENGKFNLDALNITSFNYNENTFVNQIINELWQDTIYYNRINSLVLPMSETEDHLYFKFKITIFTLNILLVGKNGTGKSTFINILKGRKIAYQTSSFGDATNKINEYLISFDNKRLEHLEDDMSFSYKLIDTLGFSTDNKESELIFNCIKEYNAETVKQKDRIHYIFYFVHDSDRSRILSNVIVDFFKFIVQQKIKVIFIINFNNNKNHECMENLNRELYNNLNEDEYKFLVEPDKSNIIELCLKQYENIKSFGLNKLMLKLESLFHGKRINSKELNEIQKIPLNNKTMNAKKANEYLNIINKCEIFNDLRTEKDLYTKCIYQAKKIIYSSFLVLFGISWIPIPGIDDAFAISIESGLISSIGKCFGIDVDLKEMPKIFKDINFGSLKGIMKFIGKFLLRIGGVAVDILKLAPPLGYIVGSAASAGINVSSAYTTGEQAIAYYLNIFQNEKQVTYLLKLYKEFNSCIDGFSYLKQYFE